MANATKHTVIEFIIEIPTLQIKMTSGLSKEDAVRILEKTMIEISKTKDSWDYESDDDCPYCKTA